MVIISEEKPIRSPLECTLVKIDIEKNIVPEKTPFDLL